MKKLFFVLAALMTVPALYAAEDTPIQNVCDSLSLGETPVIELVPAYIEESNWYGNPKTWAKDSSNAKRHETYETVKVNVSTNKTMQLPISISAGCLEKRGLEVGYAKWNTNQTWSRVSEDDFATRIYTLRELSMDGHDASNTYNLLAFVPGMIPEDLSFSSSQLLYSVTFEFAFDYWFAAASYQHRFRNADDPETTIRIRNSYASSSGNDSLRVVNGAINALAVPDTMKSIRIQTLKVVLVDSRKPLLPESSSSVVESSSSEGMSSSSEAPGPASSADVESSSSEEVIVASSSSTAESSSGSVDESSSSENVGPESSSGAESSSSGNVDESSSSENVGPASSDDTESSSSGVAEESSSSEEIGSSSSEGAETSSSAGDVSSSSEGPTRLVTVRSLGQPARMVQVRTLDGSIVKNSGNLAPGVYYVKYSNGKWGKMAVLPR